MANPVEKFHKEKHHRKMQRIKAAQKARDVILRIPKKRSKMVEQRKFKSFLKVDKIGDGYGVVKHTNVNRSKADMGQPRDILLLFDQHYDLQYNVTDEDIDKADTSDEFKRYLKACSFAATSPPHSNVLYAAVMAGCRWMDMIYDTLPITDDEWNDVARAIENGCLFGFEYPPVFSVIPWLFYELEMRHNPDQVDFDRGPDISHEFCNVKWMLENPDGSNTEFGSHLKDFYADLGKEVDEMTIDLVDRDTRSAVRYMMSRLAKWARGDIMDSKGFDQQLSKWHKEIASGREEIPRVWRQDHFGLMDHSSSYAPSLRNDQGTKSKAVEGKENELGLNNAQSSSSPAASSRTENAVDSFRVLKRVDLPPLDFRLSDVEDKSIPVTVKRGIKSKMNPFAPEYYPDYAVTGLPMIEERSEKTYAASNPRDSWEERRSAQDDDFNQNGDYSNYNNDD